MALKVLVLRKRIEPLQAELEQLRTAASSFEAREAELEQSINEAATDEEREVVETLVSDSSRRGKPTRASRPAYQARSPSWRGRSRKSKRPARPQEAPSPAQM